MEFVKEDLPDKDGLRQRINLTLPYEKIASSVDSKLLKFAQKAKIAGFRPGKAPQDVIRRQYGDAVLRDVAEDAIKETFLKLAVDKKINLAGVLAIEPKELEFGKDLTYQIDYEIYPQIDAQVPKDLGLEIINSEVTKEDVDKTIEEMRYRAAKYEDSIIGVEASEEHLAVVNYTAQTNEIQSHSFSAKELRVDLSKEYPSAEFVAAIKGMKAEQEKNFVAKVPLNMAAREGKQEEVIQEKEVSFQLKLNKLQKPILPKLNQDFFKIYGVHGTEDDFRRQVRNHMEYELGNTLSRLKYRAITKAIVKSNKIAEVPSTQVTREASRMRDAAVKLWSDMSGGKSAPDLDKIGLDSFKEMAAEKIKAGLFLGELAKDEQVSDEELDSRIEEFATVHDDPARIRKEYKENEELRQQIRNKILEDKAMAKFISMAGVKEKKMKYSEVLAMRTSAVS